MMMMMMTTVIDVFALLPDLIECKYLRPPIADACALVVNTLIIYYSYLRARLSDRAVKLLQSSWDGEMVLALPPGQGDRRGGYEPSLGLM